MATALYRNTLWVAGSRGTLFAFDVSEPRTPKLVSKLRVMKNCRQMAVRNGLAAVVGRQNGMVLVDIRNPESPRLLSRYQSIELATGIDLTEKYAYIGNRIYGVETVDISDPRHPRFLGNMLTEEAQSVRTAGNRVFVGDWAAGRIQIADASNPACLSPRGFIQLDGYGDGLDIQGNLVFASTGHHRKTGPKKDRPGNGHGVEIWDIQDPAAFPVRLSPLLQSRKRLLDRAGFRKLCVLRRYPQRLFRPERHRSAKTGLHRTCPAGRNRGAETL